MIGEFPSIYHVDLTEQTYRILREQILTRQIKPGAKISVEEIAQGLGVSRTPVVNALKSLQSDGLVEVIPRRGTFVTEITERDISELFEVRLLIELYAADQAFKTGKVKEMLEDLRIPHEKMKEVISGEDYVDYDTFIASDRDLHTKLVKEVGNQRLSQIYSDLNIHMQIARAHYLNTVENALEAQEEHEKMINALKDNDLEGFKRAITTHINRVKVRLLELFNEDGVRL